MKNIVFKFTDDGSVGLFDNSIQDIYHSNSGAKKEAIEKFINPILNCNEITNKEELKVLDICYGVGYNSKALKSILKRCKIFVDALDINKQLIAISPLIKDGVNDVNLKLELLASVLKLYDNFDSYIEDIKNYINNENKSYFDENLLNLIEFIKKEGYISTPWDINLAFLHNIYYRYISNSTNNSLKSALNNDFLISFIIDDARKSIKSLNKVYDIVFFDGFSPQKAPMLWTIDFFRKLKNKIHNDSIILTYSKSTAVRNSFLSLGFCVGKTFIDNIDMGSVFALNKKFIFNPLTKYDLELLSTTSGVPYRDPDFQLTNEEIIKNRQLEQKSSNLISHTQFLKNNR